MSKKYQFPIGFLWGTATSSYQIEGGIEFSDWSKKFPAGKASNHYHLYDKDFDLIKELNQNAYRLSIEWSRIEPKKQEFNQEAIEYYRKMFLSLRRRNIKIMVTLNHFTHPVWFSEKNGWVNPESSTYFTLFSEKMIKEYGDLVDFWITINEPLIYSLKSFLTGNWPPFKKNVFSFKKVIKNQIIAHKKIFKLFHQIQDDVKVGISKNNHFFEPYRKKNVFDKLSCFFIDYLWNKYFLNKIKNDLDFIGLNYYFHSKIKFPYILKKENKTTSDLGWEIFPEGIYHILMGLKKYNLPIYITENGLADKDDIHRKDFIKNHLIFIHKAIQEKVDVRGYLHWSLIDNFEWDKGFNPRFGLVEVDYNNFIRKIRPSAYYYAEISLNNYVNE
jgi:beta-glucosidase